MTELTQAAGNFLNRERAARLLAAAGLDALVIAEPEGFRYATGASQGVAGFFRRAGAGFAVIPADLLLPAMAVITDAAEAGFRAHSPITELRVHPAWIEAADLRLAGAGDASIAARVRGAWRERAPGFARPATFDLGSAVSCLRDLLQLHGLRHARLGFDLDFIAASDMGVITAALEGARIGNGSPVLDRLRMVKAPAEIERLRLGAELGEAGIIALREGARAGQGVTELRDLFRAGVDREAARRGVAHPEATHEYIAIGPNPWQPGVVEPGAIIKVDVVCTIEGYMSDTSRNFVFGPASPAQRELHLALEAAFITGSALIRPGVKLRDVHAVTTASLHAAGFAGYSRGHFGHSLGHSIFSEQAPFIAADATLAFEADMMMAFEIPLYLEGFGAFNLEDQLLLTEAGHVSINRLPRQLVEIG